MVKRTQAGNELLMPEQFRAMATGIGQTQQRSKASGQRRSQQVVDCTTKALKAGTGYPARDPMLAGMSSVYAYNQDGPLAIDGTV